MLSSLASFNKASAAENLPCLEAMVAIEVRPVPILFSFEAPAFQVHAPFQYPVPCVPLQETPEQRRAKLATRARALAERKEAARVAEANARLEQQFVESCDALRQMESRKRLQLIVQHRTEQVQNLHTSDATF